MSQSLSSALSISCTSSISSFIICGGRGGVECYSSVRQNDKMERREKKLMTRAMNQSMRHKQNQPNTTQHNTTNTTQRDTSEHNTAQHNTAQHNTVQHRSIISYNIISDQHTVITAWWDIRYLPPPSQRWTVYAPSAARQCAVSCPCPPCPPIQ
jgi:hypothetical protein